MSESSTKPSKPRKREIPEHQRQFFGQVIRCFNYMIEDAGLDDPEGASVRRLEALRNCLTGVREFTSAINLTSRGEMKGARILDRCPLGRRCPICNSPEFASERWNVRTRAFGLAARERGLTECSLMELKADWKGKGKQLTERLGRADDRRPMIQGEWMGEMALVLIPTGVAPLRHQGGKFWLQRGAKTPLLVAVRKAFAHPIEWQQALLVVAKPGAVDSERLRKIGRPLHQSIDPEFAHRELLRWFGRMQFSWPPAVTAHLLLELMGSYQASVRALGGWWSQVGKYEKRIREQAAGGGRLFTLGRGRSDMKTEAERRLVAAALRAQGIDHTLIDVYLRDVLRTENSIIDPQETSMLSSKQKESEPMTEERFRQILHEELEPIRQLLDQLREGTISAEEFERKSRLALGSRKVQ